jgi:GNAT superfamily N-acetyltransferase
MGHDFDPVTVELAAEATWPAEESVAIGPWRVGASHGYTRRANSVRTAHASVDADWADLIVKAEDFYRARSLRPTFHISPATVPPDLVDLLTARGYVVEAPSQVWSADPRQILAATHRTSSGKMALSESPDSAWLACAEDAHDHSAQQREQLCRRIPSPRLFALVAAENVPVSRALSVVHSNIAWLYGMATEPPHQRRGFATLIIHAIAEWAISHSARAMYLQVEAHNAPAHALYTQAKFARQYNYHYRVKNLGHE